jgi:fucose 4-O-acetylase-like acetyltransferase
MRSFWNDPFLWIHLAGLAAVPIALEVVLLGLSIGDPMLPVWLELLLVAAIGIVPVLAMQLIRPFYIFSILLVAIKPEKLTVGQRSLLHLIKTKTNKLIAIAAAIFMVWVLWQIYKIAPLATAVAPLSPAWHLAGLFAAAFAFLASNLFLQVPLSVAQVLFTNDSEFAATQPYSLEKIPQDFTIPGLKVNKILPIAAQEPKETSSEEK